MKLAALALLLVIGFPLGLYLLVGKEAFQDADIVLGMVGVGAVLFVMGCLFTAKNVLSVFFDILLICFGAFLLLIGAFARPLGLLDDEVGQDVEQRIMQQQTVPSVTDDDEPGPITRVGEEVPDSSIEAEPPETVDDETDDMLEQVSDTETDASVSAPDNKKKDKAVPDTDAVKEPEGLERFSEESGQD